MNNPLSHNEGSYLREGFILLCGFFGPLSFFQGAWGGSNNAQVCDFLKGELTRTFVLLIEGEPLEIGLADPGRRYATGNPNERNEKKEEGKKQTNKKKLIGCIESFYQVGRQRGLAGTLWRAAYMLAENTTDCTHAEMCTTLDTRSRQSPRS